MPNIKITDRLSKGETLLLDGGTGSELQRRGANVLKGATSKLKAWSATTNIEFSDVVRQVHRDYLRVGADIIISNNFVRMLFCPVNAHKNNAFFFSSAAG